MLDLSLNDRGVQMETAPEYPRGNFPSNAWAKTDEAEKKTQPPDGAGDKDGSLGAKSLLNGFLEKTTSHGVSHIFQAKGYFKKIVWVFLSLTVLGLLVFHNWYLFSSFFDYSINTKTTINVERKLMFPAVTVCNNNAVRSSKKGIILDDLFLSIAAKEAANQTGPSHSASLWDDYIKELAEASFIDKKVAGHQQEDFILYCDYAADNCNMTSDFWLFSHPVYGNCFTFNGATKWQRKQGAPMKVATKAGPHYGLSITLSVQEYEYIPFITTATGVVIVIHDPEVMPFPELNGISAAPGGLYSVSIHETRIKRLPEPYTNCTQVDNADHNAYNAPFGVVYSQHACFFTCYQKEVEAECNCFDPSFPRITAGLDPCEVESEGTFPVPAEVKCRNDVLREYEEDRLDCSHCLEPCQEKFFTPSISGLKWPVSTNLIDLKESLESDFPRLFHSLITANPTLSAEEIIRNNFLQVNIYYRALQYDNIEYTPAYSMYQFISDVGGCFGLWVGWSIMTVFEMVELLNDLIAVCMVKMKMKKKDNRGPGPREQKVASTAEVRRDGEVK